MIEEQIPRKIAETGLKMKRKVKDSVFTKLFAEQGYVVELYEALSGKSAKKNPEIEVITLETVLRMAIIMIWDLLQMADSCIL